MAEAIADVVDRDARMREAVGHLASLDRRTGTPGERESAAWFAARLERIGVTDVSVSTFRTQSSWGAVQGAFAAAGLLAAARNGALGRALALAVAAAYELDTSGRSQWSRRLPPAVAGSPVCGRIAAAGEPRRTLLLSAHHDAAIESIVWHPSVTAANRWCSRRHGRTLASHAPLLAGMVLAAMPSRRARGAGAGLLALAGVAVLESVGNRTAPGANDNASGVGAVLELADELARRPLEHTEVVVVFPGGEEVGNTGIRAWLAGEVGSLGSERTLLVNLDSVGSGEELVVSRREALSASYASRDVRLAVEAAAAEGIPLREAAFANITDAFAARLAGLRAISILSYEGGWIANLHRRSDTPANVRWNTVEAARALTMRIARSWDAGAEEVPA